MQLHEVDKLIDEIGEDMLRCGDVEYSYLHQIRGALASYAEAMRSIGPGKPRECYKEKELKP